MEWYNDSNEGCYQAPRREGPVDFRRPRIHGDRPRGEYLAERKWRAVHVTPAETFDETPESGEYRCFVAWTEDVPDLETRLEAADPDYEWAIMGVDDEGDYEVASRRTSA